MAFGGISERLCWLSQVKQQRWNKGKITKLNQNSKSKAQTITSVATAPSLVNADDNEHWDVPVGFSSVCLHLKLRTSHQHQESVMDMCCVCKERIAETNSENSNHFFLQVCSPLMAFSLCVSSLVMSALRGLVARPELSSAFVNSNHTSSWPWCYRFPSKMSLRESAFVRTNVRCYTRPGTNKNRDLTRFAWIPRPL